MLCGLKTLCAAALLLVQAPEAAQSRDWIPRSPSARLELFETCAGRLSALIAHQWLIDPAASDATAALRDEFDALIEAVLPDALAWGVPRHMAMHWRVSAKAAQADLLAAAAFSLDPVRAARARRAADARLGDCHGLLVS